MIKKIALIYGLLAIVLVALAGGAAWYFKSTTPIGPDDTIPPTATDCTDELDTRCWQTYRNEEYGFEFKYPIAYYLDTTYELKYPDQSHIYLYENGLYAGIQEGAPIIQVSTFNNPEQLVALEWAKKDQAHSNFVDNFQVIKINNSDGLLYSWTGLGSGDTFLLQGSEGKYILSFSALYMDEWDKIRTDFNNIIKTIKLID